ncbi:MAG TPA: metallophosphoesterase [Thermoanaerobaculia bacterium]|nr:metallophosphoesterase [Thermoanaerobaculia bacterium]
MFPLLIVLGLVFRGAGSPQTTPTAAATPAADPVLVGAGDIASCDSDGDEKTAALLDRIEGTVFTLGDNVYGRGTLAEFTNCYAPSWGRHRSRTRPAAGNHDYRTPGAAAYFTYFGAAAGDPAKGYYSYDLGAWHIVVLNSNCAEVGGCAKGSPQEKWLREDLLAHAVPCTAALWHHPRFSSADHGDDLEMADIWRTLYELDVDVTLSGHDHDYERFAPLDAEGRPDPRRGIRSFVVGTGGKSHYDFKRIHPTSEVRNNDTYGVLKLTLHPSSYDWEFVPVEGRTFRDSGTASCH